MVANAERMVYLNGMFVPEKEARFSIYDSSLMFGDMVFEMTRSFNGKQFLLRLHLERLYRGIKMLRIPIKVTMAEMESLVYKTMEMNQPSFLSTDEHRMLINVSRGPLSIYKMVFDGKLEPTVVIADFPVKWTLAALAHFLTMAFTPSLLTSERFPRSSSSPRSRTVAGCITCSRTCKSLS